MVIENLPEINEGFLEKSKKEVIRRENLLARRLPPRVTPTLATPLGAPSSGVVRPLLSPLCNLKLLLIVRYTVSCNVDTK